MRIAFAGGGTWWHVFPIRSLIQHIHSHEEYNNKAALLAWFGEANSLEEQTSKEFPDVQFIRIVSGKIRRGANASEWIKNIWDMVAVIGGIAQSLWFLSTKKIDVIFCKWGYVSLPVVIAGWILRKKIILHESDTKAGLSNKICAKFATTIFTWFEGVFPGKEKVVGQILSDDLTSIDSDGKLTDDHDREKTHILVTWGSQGAESVYKPLSELIRKNGYMKSHFYVTLGTKNTWLRKFFEGLSNVTCYDFVSQIEMGRLLSICDAAITRAGTTSLAEEKLFWLKLVMIPIPWTHDQVRNAQYYEKSYGDILVKQDDSFLLQLPNALEKIQGYKKSFVSDQITQSINKAKDIICTSIFAEGPGK